MVRILVLFFVLLASTSYAQSHLYDYGPSVIEDKAIDNSWTTEDTLWQSAFVGITLVDYAQTSWAMRRADYREANPVLGPRPSQERLNYSIGAAILAHTLISAYLDKPNRRAWQIIGITIESWAVYHNYGTGCQIVVPF